MATTNERLIIDVVVRTLKAQEALKKTTKTGKDFEKSLDDITSSEKALNQLGIQTQAQIQKQIKLREELITYLGTKEPQAVRRLQAEMEQLRLSQSGAVTSTRQQEQALFSLGFILDDARQFSVDFGAGLRAISNNIQPLITQLSRAEGGLKGWISTLKGPAGAIIAVNTLLAVLALFGDKIAELTEGPTSIKELKSALEELVELDLPDLSFKVTGKEAKAVSEGIKGEIKGVEGALGEVANLPSNITRYTLQALATTGAFLKDLGLQVNERTENFIALNQALSETEAVGEVFSGLAKKSSAFDRALKELGEEGLSPVNEIIDGLLQKIDDLTLGTNTYTGSVRDLVVELTRRKIIEEQNLKLAKLRAKEEAQRKGDTAALLAAGRANIRLTTQEIKIGEKRADLTLAETSIFPKVEAQKRRELALLERRLDVLKQVADAEVGSLRIKKAKVRGVDEAFDVIEALFPTPQAIRKGSLEYATFVRDSMLTQLTLAFGEDFAASIGDAFPGKFLVQGFKNLNEAIDEFGAEYVEKITKHYGDGPEALKALDKVKAFNTRLSATLTSGISSAIGATVEALASGESVGDVLLQSFGRLAVRLGRLMIAFGTSGIALKNLIKDPYLALAAGAALVALGTYASKAAQGEVSKATGSGGGGSVTGGFPRGARGRPPIGFGDAVRSGGIGGRVPDLPGPGSIGYSGRIGVVVEGVIKGTDLVLVQQRAVGRMNT